MDTLKQWVREWWGLVAPLLIFFVSDMGLPDGAPRWVSWMAFAVSVASYLLGRHNGEQAARESYRQEAKERDELLAQKDDQIEKLDGELSAIKGNLQSLLDEWQDREDEKRERDEARQAAMAIKPDNKLLLLQLSMGRLLTISMNVFDLQNMIVDLYGLVEHTEVGFDVHELWISDHGMRVVELAGDILSKVRPDAVYPWWRSGRFSSDDQREAEYQDDPDQGSPLNLVRPISAKDVEGICADKEEREGAE